MAVCQWVHVYYLWRPNLPDEGDNHIVELAIAGYAQTIVTNNTRDFKKPELLFPRINIIKPNEFLEAP